MWESECLGESVSVGERVWERLRELSVGERVSVGEREYGRESD